MVMAAFPYQNFHLHLRDLQDEDIDAEEFEHLLRDELQLMLSSLAEQREALAHIEQGFEEAAKNHQTHRAFDFWQFVEVADPDGPGVREVLSKLPSSDELLDLLNRVISERRSVVARKEAIDKAVLSAWRKKNPRFSSMGALESGIQSESLRDAEELARR